MCCHLESQIKLNYHNLYDPPCAAIWMVKLHEILVIFDKPDGSTS